MIFEIKFKSKIIRIMF